MFWKALTWEPLETKSLRPQHIAKKMTIQISANSPCDWVSVHGRRLVKHLGLIHLIFFPIIPHTAPLYWVHIALCIDYKSDAMFSRHCWTNLDLNIYSKPKDMVPLPSDVAPIKTECDNSERRTLKSGRATNKECSFIFLLLMLLLGSVGGLFHEKKRSQISKTESAEGVVNALFLHTQLWCNNNKKNLPNDKLLWHYK